MNRLTTLLLALLAFAQGALHAENAPPNILFVMVDDLGPADLACYGSQAVHTPRLDAFARTGLKFNQAYAGCTVCAPTRSVLMTGVHMGRTSVRLNTGGVPLRDSDVTVAEVLKTAGYTTGGFGKWGIGDIGTEGVPEKQGFDHFHGYYHQIHAHSYWPEYLIRNGKKEPNTPRQRGTTTGYSHYQTVTETKKFIRGAVGKKQPFFCYAPWCPPHGEYLVPKEDPALAHYRDKPWDKKTKHLAAMITMIDRQFGELLDLLDELGVAENTVVIFSSDNGGSELPDAMKNLDPGGPFQGHKRSMHEGGIRTPFLVRWPGVTQPGSETEFIVSHHDVLPTLAEVAGVRDAIPAEVTGLSFVETLAGKPQSRRHDYHYWEWATYDWKQRQLVPDGLMQALRQGDWKILRHRSDAAWQLYHLPDDWGEEKNLAQKHPEKVAALARLAEAARTPMRPQAEPRMPEGKSYR